MQCVCLNFGKESALYDIILYVQSSAEAYNLKTFISYSNCPKSQKQLDECWKIYLLKLQKIKWPFS